MNIMNIICIAMALLTIDLVYKIAWLLISAKITAKAREKQLDQLILYVVKKISQLKKPETPTKGETND